MKYLYIFFLNTESGEDLISGLDRVFFGGGDYFSGYESGLTYVQNFEYEGEIHIICSIKNPRPEIIAHEALHVLYHISDITGAEITTDSQEWQAIMLEYIVKEIHNTPSDVQKHA